MRMENEYQLYNYTSTIDRQINRYINREKDGLKGKQMETYCNSRHNKEKYK